MSGFSTLSSIPFPAAPAIFNHLGCFNFNFSMLFRFIKTWPLTLVKQQTKHPLHSFIYLVSVSVNEKKKNIRSPSSRHSRFIHFYDIIHSNQRPFPRTKSSPDQRITLNENQAQELPMMTFLLGRTRAVGGGDGVRSRWTDIVTFWNLVFFLVGKGWSCKNVNFFKRLGMSNITQFDKQKLNFESEFTISSSVKFRKQCSRLEIIS